MNQQKVRELYTLISDCRAAGGDGVGWRSHLVNGIYELLDVDMVCFIDFRSTLSVGTKNAQMRPVSRMERWRDNENRRQFWEPFPHQGWLVNNKRMQSAIEDESIRSASGGDGTWEGDSRCFEFDATYVPTATSGHCICSASHIQDGHVQWLAIQRAASRPDFPRWVTHWLRALRIELRTQQPSTLKCVSESVFSQIPRRRLQVLACLLSGCTVEETAALLGIRPNTAQEHVKRLYQQSGTRNRAGLAARYKEVAPVLLAMSLEEVSETARNIQQATRTSWPLSLGLVPYQGEVATTSATRTVN